jgi:hypothetical protein
VIDDWFYPWFGAHRERHPGMTFPLPDTEAEANFTKSWITVFRKRGVHDEPIATEASEILAGERLKHSSEHFPRLVEIAVDLYRDKTPVASASGAPLSDRDFAYAAAKGCPFCAGEGLCSVWHRAPDYAKRRPETAAAYCVCAMGKWVEGRHAGTFPRIPRLEAVLLGRTDWRLEPPGLAPVPADLSPREMLTALISKGKE